MAYRALTLAACASAQTPYPAGMMAGRSGSAPTYHYSRLTCSAPSSLPAHSVTVVLADMGMSQMMGGTAPLAARRVLRATQTIVPAGSVSLVATNVGWRTQELVLLPLAAEASAEQRVPRPDGKVEETSSLGETSKACGDGGWSRSGHHLRRSWLDDCHPVTGALRTGL